MLRTIFTLLLTTATAFAAATENTAAGTPSSGGREIQKSGRPARRSRILEHFDKDGDGRLNDEENAELRRHLDRRLEVRFDKDKDGKLNKEERERFENFLKLREARRNKMRKRNTEEHAQIWKKMREARRKALDAKKSPAAPAAGTEPASSEK